MFFASLGLIYWTSQKSFETVMEETLRRSTESSHGDMVLFASNSLRDEINLLVDEYERQRPIDDWAGFLGQEHSRAFNAKVQDLFEGTNVLKLKIYATDGYTIFSTDPSQIGEEKSEVEEVTHALRGRSSSQFTFRDRFVTMAGNRVNIEVVSSYHPLNSEATGINGVVEVYSDRSSDFLISEKNVKDKLANLIIFLAFASSSWLIALIYYNLRHRSEDS